MVGPKRMAKLFVDGRLWFGLVFFALCYVTMWRLIKPDLIYHGFGTIVVDVPVFSTGWRFFRDAFDVPGGLVLYAHGFLSQWYYYPWLGALVVTLVALGLCELTRRHHLRAGQRCPRIVSCFPAIAILWIYSQYDHPLAACLTLTAGLAFSYGFEALPIRHGPIRMAVFCLLAGFGYWLAGAGAVAVLAMVTTVHALLTRRDWLSGFLALPVAAGILWVLAEYVFFISPRQAFLAMTPFSRHWAQGVKVSSTVLMVTLHAFVPATVALTCFCRTVLRPRLQGLAPLPKKKHGSKERTVEKSHRPVLAPFAKIAGPALPIAILALGLYFTYDKTHRQIVEMNALSRQGRWSDGLALGRRLPKNAYNIHCNHDVDRALYCSGRLGYDMLCFPQNPHALLLTHESEESSVTQLKMCAAFLELGNVDLAEKLASEFIVAQGNLAVVLEKLAWINVIKGREETARVYLNILTKDPIRRDRARRMLDHLNDGFGPAETEYIREIRSYIPQNNHGRLNKEPVQEMLTGLLAHNSRNRMAFEYLMAYYLLAGRLDEIAANFGRVKELGYQEVPTLYEEAMLIYYGARRQRLNLNELNIKRQTFDRYTRFVQLDNSMQGPNSQAVFQQLLSEFGTSYFFYYRFAIVGQAAQAAEP